jgi:hypothetical protein
VFGPGGAKVLLHKQRGVVIFQLKTFGSEQDGIHNVDGEMVVRDGNYVSEHDLLLKLQGTHLVGRLHGFTFE